MTLRLLIYSDLHLDANSFNPVLPNGSRVDENVDLVILAGDIDEGTRGIRWARETFPDKGILYVAGNHEYYSGHWTRTLDELREVAGKFDVDFLECDGIDIAGVRFLGTSLWSDFQLFGPDHESGAMKRARASMMDYHEIHVTRTPENLAYLSRGKYLSPELTAERHRGSVAWLESKLKSGDPSKTVVITHHAPHPNSVPDRFKPDLLSAAYASHLSRLMGRSGLWVHGHIHDGSDYDVNGTRVVCNPRGYLHRNGGYENPNFNMNFIVEV